MEPIAREKDLISMHRGALVSGFVNILVYFNKQANTNFETTRYFFQQFEIFKINSRFICFLIEFDFKCIVSYSILFTWK